jgi:uridylate kinase
MTGADWNPGANVPFDPVAAARARETGLKVIFASGTNLQNLSDILYEKAFVGTIIE